MIGSKCLKALYKSDQGICIFNRRWEKVYENERAKQIFKSNGVELCLQFKTICQSVGKIVGIAAAVNSLIHHSGVLRYPFNTIIFSCFSFGTGEDIYICIIFDYIMKKNGVRDNIALTPREKEIIQIMAQGKTNKEISEILCIGLETVKSHIRNLFVKTGASTRVELLAKVLAAFPAKFHSKL